MKRSCAEAVPHGGVTRGIVMPRRPGASGLILLAWSFFCAGTLNSPARAQSGAEQVGDRQQQLDALKGQIEENRREIEKLRSKERDLSRLQERIRRDGELTGRYLRELQAQDELIRSGSGLEPGRPLRQRGGAARDGAPPPPRPRPLLTRCAPWPAPSCSSPRAPSASSSPGRSSWPGSSTASGSISRRSPEERRALADGTAALERRRRSVEMLEAEKRREEERLRRQGRGRPGGAGRSARRADRAGAASEGAGGIAGRHPPDARPAGEGPGPGP